MVVSHPIPLNMEAPQTDRQTENLMMVKLEADFEEIWMRLVALLLACLWTQESLCFGWTQVCWASTVKNPSKTSTSLTLNVIDTQVATLKLRFAASPSFKNRQGTLGGQTVTTMIIDRIAVLQVKHIKAKTSHCSQG
jgi:hypothetical protein